MRLCNFLPAMWPLAQGAVDPLSGATGWVGTGLLGAVLAWILGRHLPSLVASMDAKDRQIKELIDGKDRQLKEFIDSRDVLIRELWAKHSEQWRAALVEIQKAEVDQRVDYQTSLQRVLEHCQREGAAVNSVLLAEFRNLIGKIRKDHLEDT